MKVTFEIHLVLLFCLKVLESCPIGEELLNGSCQFCRPGYFNDGTKQLCAECPFGFASNSGAKVCTEVYITCPSGFYIDDQNYCTPCDPGNYCPTGKGLGRGSGLVCPPNQHAGMYSFGGIRLGAVACADIQTSTCPDGSGLSFSNPVHGEPDYSSHDLGCLSCPPGTYQDSSSTVCLKCNNGSYSAVSSSTCLQTCPPGTGYEVNSNLPGACLSCAPGFYQDGSGLFCKECPDLTASFVDQIGRKTCIPVKKNCSPGQFFSINLENIESRETGSCGNCLGGEFTSNGKAMNCQRCSNGYESHQSNAVACTSSSSSTCPMGSGVISNSIKGCYLCDAGYFNDGISLRCLFCPNGLVSGKGSGTCNSTCPAGFGRGVETGQGNLEFISVAAYNSQSCIPCPPGFYNDGRLMECSMCPGEFFSVDKDGLPDMKFLYFPDTGQGVSCEKCIYPYRSFIDIGYTTMSSSDYPYNTDIQPVIRCAIVNFGLTDFMSALLAILSFLYCFSLALIPLTLPRSHWSWKFILGFIVLTISPVIDNFTDIAYLLTNDFFIIKVVSIGVKLIMPILCACTIAFSMLHFTFFLFEKKSWARFVIPIPTCLRSDNYDNFYRIFAISPWILINAPFWSPWFILGCFLYVSKIIALGPVRNLWFKIWTGTDEFATETLLDGALLNTSIYSEQLYETLPQLMLQMINNMMLSRWTPLGIFSIAFSIFNSISGLYRVFYYKISQKVDLVNIPVSSNIFGYELINVDNSKIYSENEMPSLKTGFDMMACSGIDAELSGHMISVDASTFNGILSRLDMLESRDAEREMVVANVCQKIEKLEISMASQALLSTYADGVDDLPSI